MCGTGVQKVRQDVGYGWENGFLMKTALEDICSSEDYCSFYLETCCGSVLDNVGT
jgi:hypothetical protein